MVSNFFDFSSSTCIRVRGLGGWLNFWPGAIESFFRGALNGYIQTRKKEYPYILLMSTDDVEGLEGKVSTDY